LHPQISLLGSIVSAVGELLNGSIRPQPTWTQVDVRQIPAEL
jgi:hypothetical protein